MVHTPTIIPPAQQGLFVARFGTSLSLRCFLLGHIWLGGLAVHFWEAFMLPWNAPGMGCGILQLPAIGCGCPFPLPSRSRATS